MCFLIRPTFFFFFFNRPPFRLLPLLGSCFPPFLIDSAPSSFPFRRSHLFPPVPRPLLPKYSLYNSFPPPYYTLSLRFLPAMPPLEPTAPFSWFFCARPGLPPFPNLTSLPLVCCKCEAIDAGLSWPSDRFIYCFSPCLHPRPVFFLFFFWLFLLPLLSPTAYPRRLFGTSWQACGLLLFRPSCLPPAGLPQFGRFLDAPFL